MGRDLPGTNLEVTGFGYDANGNWVIRIKNFGDGRGYSFQTNGSMPETHKRSKWISGKVQDLTDEDLQIIAKEVIEKIGYSGSKRQKEKLWTSETDPLRRESSKRYSNDTVYLIDNLTYQDFEDAWHSLDNDGVLESFNEEERGIADRDVAEIVDAIYDIEEELYVPTSENELYIVEVEGGDILVAGYSIDACHIVMSIEQWQETVNELRSREARAKKSDMSTWNKAMEKKRQSEKEKKEVEPVKEARRRYSEESDWNNKRINFFKDKEIDLSYVNPNKIEVEERNYYLILSYEGRPIARFYYNMTGWVADFNLRKPGSGHSGLDFREQSERTVIRAFKKALRDGYILIRPYDI